MQSIKVNPDGVNVSATAATVVFLTFGGLVNHRPADGCWCGELVPATPDLGFKCNPATVFGCLPERLDFSTRSGNTGFTDIMSIPPSVARRAYQAAEEGQTSSFFYVRRFINTAGGPDEYVAVTCRMTGGGARTPFALTDVKLSFRVEKVEKAVLLVEGGQKLPPIKAEISYNGTGRLKGRWEVVLPGEEPPTDRDLLTEATLPVEERGQQRRFSQVGSFNVFLPPAGKYFLPGPDVSRLPTTLEGRYAVLLRIEASDDKEGDSSLAVAGAGAGVVHSGAVAGFPMPPLYYYVGAGSTPRPNGVELLSPAEAAVHPANKPVEFSWSVNGQASLYRLEVSDSSGKIVFSALVRPGTVTYRAPSWLKEKLPDGQLRWRVTALDHAGNVASETAWRSLRISP
jgi:hypothetical protein